VLDLLELLACGRLLELLVTGSSRRLFSQSRGVHPVGPAADPASYASQVVQKERAPASVRGQEKARARRRGLRVTFVVYAGCFLAGGVFWGG
jgi:hypothetical protein